MKFIKIALVALLIVSILGIVSCKSENENEDEVFTISDELLSYEDEVKKDRIDSIYMFYIGENKEVRELDLGKGADEASMKKIIEELSGIELTRMDKDDIQELKDVIDKWEKRIFLGEYKEQDISINGKEIVCEIKPTDTSNFTGPVRLQDKITDRIFILSTGDLIFKMPEQGGDPIPEEVFYENTEIVSGKEEAIMEIIEGAYYRRNPKIVNGIDRGGQGVELEIVGHEYRAIWKESYQYDTPILIDSRSELEEFLNRHPAQSPNEDILQGKFKDDFFDENLIYAYVKSEGSGSVSLTVDKAEVQGDVLKLFINRVAPEIGTADMATRVCLFGIYRDDIKNVEEVEVIIVQ